MALSHHALLADVVELDLEQTAAERRATLTLRSSQSWPVLSARRVHFCSDVQTRSGSLQGLESVAHAWSPV